MADLVSPIRDRYLKTLDAIAASAQKGGRSADSVRLVVVTKTHPVNVVEAVIQAGARILGENYADEAVEKILALKAQTAVEWHMIGHVQSRKAQLVADHFALFHALDSQKLAERLDRFASRSGRRLPVLLEFNVGSEETKPGWRADDESSWPALIPSVEAIIALPFLKAGGLMTMPPLSTGADAARTHFQRLYRLREFFAERLPQADWRELSMGTSNDYEVAVEEGATLVRIGRAILGPRPEG
jgi:pyridoxal phosphate enzyme (YggS family)